MRHIHPYILPAVLACLLSCEKDFVEDGRCTIDNGHGDIDRWEQPMDTAVVQSPDTVGGVFIIDVNEWGDTITMEYPIR